MVKIMEKPYEKMDDLGVPGFGGLNKISGSL